MYFEITSCVSNLQHTVCNKIVIKNSCCFCVNSTKIYKNKAKKHPKGEQLNRSCLSISKSIMQKIDAFQATVLCFRTRLKCAERTRDRWSWVSDACLPSIPPKAKENKWGQGNVCVCV